MIVYGVISVRFRIRSDESLDIRENWGSRSGWRYLQMKTKFVKNKKSFHLFLHEARHYITGFVWQIPTGCLAELCVESKFVFVQSVPIESSNIILKQAIKGKAIYNCYIYIGTQRFPRNLFLIAALTFSSLRSNVSELKLISCVRIYDGLNIFNATLSTENCDEIKERWQLVFRNT